MVGRMPLPIYPCIPLLEGTATSKAFRGGHEVTPLANGRCTAATVESPLDFRIMHGKKGTLKRLVRAAGSSAPHRVPGETNEHDFRGVRPSRRSLGGKGQTFEGNN